MRHRNVTSPFDRALETLDLSRAAASGDPRSYSTRVRSASWAVRPSRQRARRHDDLEIQPVKVREVNREAVNVAKLARGRIQEHIELVESIKL